MTQLVRRLRSLFTSSRPDREARIEHALLVAGPGAVGKTTFIAMLAAGDLEPELMRRLPEGAGGWPTILPETLRRRHPESVLPPAFIVHYDVAGFARKSGTTYSADTALLPLHSAARVTVVDMRTSNERLLHQLTTRSERKVEARSTRWYRALSPLATIALHPRKSLARDRLPPKRTLYARSDWLERVYLAWDAYLGELEARSNVRVLRIEPRDGPDGPRFALREEPRG